jgi:spermidine/putrescine transport system permease protein
VYRRWLWPSFALPGILWLIVLFVVPFYAVLAVALGTVDPILFINAIPAWNPANWNVGWIVEALNRLAPGGTWYGVGIRTLEYVAASLALCLLIGYPVAYYVARHAGRWKGVLLVLIVLPLWISYMMRMLAWVNLLQTDGYVNRFLTFTHMLSQPHDWLGGHSSTVVFALVYGYIPYFILPLFASLDRIDRSHLEAARDLGASPWSAFRHVTLPLSKTGILGGAVLITLPMFGDYFTPNIVSQTPRTSMIGNQIDFYFHSGPQPTLGAALTILLAAFLTVLMAYYMWTIHRAQREVGTVGAV